MRTGSIVCLVIALGLCAAWGCRKKEKVKTEWPADPEISEAQDELRDVKPDAGDEGALEVAGDYGAKIPPHFPKDVPLPKDIIVKSAHEVDQRFALKLGSASTVREVADQLAKGLESKGWKLRAPEISGKEAFISGEKDDRLVSVVITRTGMGCEIELDVPRPTADDE